jgi:two-component system, NarL family, response regulator
MQKENIRILIVDDHPVVRAGLTSMLGTQPGMEVVGSVPSGEEALTLLDQLEADVMLVDLRMPGMTGIDTIRAVSRRKAAPRTIVLTSFETDEDVYRAVEAGSHGYLLKNTPQQEMLEAIRLVHAKHRYFPPTIAARLAERMARSSLTPREYQILQMLAKGLTNKEIGRVFGISENTARNHVNNIIEKLEASDRTGAVTTAIQRGLISVTG